jgi:hypothetical protein
MNQSHNDSMINNACLQGADQAVHDGSDGSGLETFDEVCDVHVSFCFTLCVFAMWLL